MTDSSFNAEKFNPNRHALPPVSLTDKFEADDVVIGAVGSKPQLIGLPESVDGIKAEVIAISSLNRASAPAWARSLP